MRHLKDRGVTLVELMVAIAITTFLLMAAWPALVDYLSNSRLRGEGSALLSDVLFAQGEGVKRNGNVHLAIHSHSWSVLDASIEPPVVLRDHPLPSGVFLSGDETMAFGSEGHPVPWGAEHSVKVQSTAIGCGPGLRCPMLQVYAGGAVKLCVDGSACP